MNGVKICATSKDDGLCLLERCVHHEHAAMKTSSPHIATSFSSPRWWVRLEKLLTELYRLGEREPAAAVATLPDSTPLGARKVLHLRQSSGVQRIHVRQGVVWLTRTPADGDLILQAGDQLELDHGWPVVMQALQDARIDFWH